MSASFGNRLLFSPTMIQNKIIALWALSEAGFGGVLHLLKIPFSSMAIIGLSVFFVALLAFFSKGSYQQIFKATIIILLIKMTVSPHSPAMAYFAVWFQGILGWLIFSIFRFNWLSLAIFASLAFLESAIQKVLVLTLYYGLSVWDSIDVFVKYVAKQFGFFGAIDFSKWLVASYLTIYLIGGLFVAYITIRVTKTITNDFSGLREAYGDFHDEEKKVVRKKRLIGKRSWLGIILVFVLGMVLFFNPSTSGTGKAVYIFFRTIAVIMAWYIIVGPVVKRVFEYFLKKKKKKFAAEVSSIIDSFPFLRSISRFSWHTFKPLKGINNMVQFLSAIIFLSLSADEEEK